MVMGLWFFLFLSCLVVILLLSLFDWKMAAGCGTTSSGLGLGCP